MTASEDYLEQLLDDLKKLSTDDHTEQTTDENDITKEFLDPTSKSKFVKQKQSIEEKNEFLKENYLVPNNELQWDLLNEFQDIPKITESQTTKFYNNLISLPSSFNNTTVRFKRKGLKGSIVSYSEKFDLSALESSSNSATNSISLKRKFTSKNDSLRGNSTFLPFKPGGLDTGMNNQKTDIADNTKFLHRDPMGLFDVPQGLTRGLNLELTGNNNNTSHDIDLSQLEEDQEQDNNIESLLPSSDNNSHVIESLDKNVTNNSIGNGSKYLISESDEKDIAEILPDDTLLLRPQSLSDLNKSALGSKQKKKEWAHVVELTHDLENFEELVPNMAREWPFKLDVFQQEAVYHLEQGDSVFVAAHTSAGKTVVAEYAIAMAHRNMTKTIYTSPIKALSNQKFRDFKQTFKDVDIGVITGDVQINPDANCLIMTTEILRSMLYRGADLIRDVEFVIFDEVHYVNDIDRGVVWEEVIIMLPDHIKVILLSATVPNTYEFASWVGRTKQKDIYVISTPKRPVPLELFVWAKDDVFKVVHANRKFLVKGFKDHEDKLVKRKDVSKLIKGEANNASGRGGGGGAGRGGARGGARGNSRGGRGGARGGFQGNNNGNSGNRFQRDGPNRNTWVSLVQYLKKHDLLPGVVFVFSKKRCEEYADTLQGVNFCTNKEASEIHMFINQAVSRLKKEDRELPQILKIREMLSRGIAVHHGGLLPIVKEVIEILFSKSLIKVLFATETFAMGLNLPTRTVVFSELRKHDGTGFRNLLPGEFTQMSGRAGRRGLDETGTVIIMSYNNPLIESDFKEVTLGIPTKLSSQFRLTYSMILNLLRIEALKVEEMIKRSFSENTTQSLLPEHQQKVKDLEAKLEKDYKMDKCPNETLNKLEIFYNMMDELRTKYGLLVKESLKLSFYQKDFHSPRLIFYRDPVRNETVPAISIRFWNNSTKVTILSFIDVKESKKVLNNCVFTPDLGKDYKSLFFPRWKYTTDENNLRFKEIDITQIEFVTLYKLNTFIKDAMNHEPNALKSLESELNGVLMSNHIYREVNWKKFMDKTTQELFFRIDELRELIDDSFDFSNEQFVNDLKKYYPTIINKMNLKNEIQSLKDLISEDNLELLPDYTQRLEILKLLEFIEPQQLTVNLKGRVACEINSGWELVLTELVFDNFLGDFTSEEIVALLSCFVYEGKKNNNNSKNNADGGATQVSLPTLETPRLEKGKEKIIKIVKDMLQVYNDYQINLTADEESFLERDRFALVNTVYEWAKGLSFKEIMEMFNDSEESEGTIVRVITRLDEICREVKNCALIIGDSDLHLKMNDAQEKIKRDIVFCASLYL
ncbi:hypothetical protein B5S31_g3089 [[Candida] boidinii]|nr:hypothetical protein B5S31_g3089 [[Candida] boidinii]